LSDEDISKYTSYWDLKPEALRPYPECKYVPYCQNSCSFHVRALAKQISRRIFMNNFDSKSSSFDLVVKVFGQISTLIRDELNGELYSRELLSCVKVNLFRRIRHGTNIEIPEVTIRKSLEKR